MKIFEFIGQLKSDYFLVNHKLTLLIFKLTVLRCS